MVGIRLAGRQTRLWASKMAQTKHYNKKTMQETHHLFGPKWYKYGHLARLINCQISELMA